MEKYTEQELALKILNNPHMQLKFLKCSYPRSSYQATVIGDAIRVDFGYFEFKEDKNSLYFKLSDYGITWEFRENRSE